MYFSEECGKLRSQLNEQHREENRVSLVELTRVKDIQRDQLREELQSKIDALRKTVSGIKFSSNSTYHGSIFCAPFDAATNCRNWARPHSRINLCNNIFRVREKFSCPLVHQTSTILNLVVRDPRCLVQKV